MRRIFPLLLVLTAPAHAEPKFTHDPGVKLDVRLTDRSKPPPKRSTPSAPAATASQILQIQVLLGAVHTEQVKLLRDLIARTPDAEVEEKADLYFRLGEIHAKTYRLHRLKAVEAELAKQQATRASHAKQATTALVATIETYRELIDSGKFTTYQRLDLALFYYAYTLHQAEKMPQARAAYEKLLREHPRTRFAAEAHLALGDGDFEAKRLADAAGHYRLVLKLPKSSAYWYAMYKLGWVELEQNHTQSALELFFQVAQGTQRTPEYTLLFRAAKKDFVRAYATIGKADKALQAFLRVDAADAHGMLEILGDLYLDQGKSEPAIYVFRQLMTRVPTSPHVCRWQHAVARSMLTLGTVNDRVTEIEQLVKLYRAVKGDAECRDAASEMSGQLARAYHQEAVKTKNPELATHAGRLYRAYLGAFAGAKDYGETQYYAAELAWVAAEFEPKARLATERWAAAAQAFTVVARGKLVEPKLVKVAADAAMLAQMKALQVDPTVRQQPIDDAAYATVPKPKQFPEREQALLAAYDLYLTHVTDPKDDERIDVTFHKANLLRRFDHHEPALAIFEQIIAAHPGHETAEWSAQLALDSYNRLQRYDDMLAFAGRMTPAFLADKPGLRETVAKLGKQGIRKEAERLEAEGKRTGALAKFVACALKYYDAYNLDPLASDGDALLYNAGICFEQGRSIGAAMQAYEKLQQLFPNTKLAKRSVARLGNVYASIAFYDKAAAKLEEYATKYAGETDAFDALSDAVVFRRGTGADAQAIDNANRFVRMFGAKQPEKAADAFFSIAAIYEKQGDLAKLARHLKTYIDRHGAAGGNERLVTAWARLGQTLWQSACPVATVDGACVRVVREAATSRRVRARVGIAKRCGEETQIELTVVSRDARKVATAMAAFDQAIAAYDKGGKSRGALYHYASAKLGKLERDYEQFLALAIPESLDFDSRKPAVAKKSGERFEAWLLKKRDLAVAIRKGYDAVVALGDGAVAIAAAARSGAVLHHFSAQLFRAEIPVDQRTGQFAEEKAQTYCDTLAIVAEPLETEAVGSYQACLVTSTKLGWFSEWSRICERELGQLQPGTWPTTAERRRRPDAAATITLLEGPVRL
ncbi:MAG TPA: tetratricopeptide repeat protein [Kofleriaceae bacterium]